MAISSGRVPRLHCEAPLAPAAQVALGRDHAHYLAGVLRLGPGAEVRLFNGRDGEWRCTLAEAGRKAAVVRCGERLRPPDILPDIDYLFAPLKAARLDYLAQKATEMGVRRLRPVLTRHTVAGRVNVERLRANAVEAAEQCNMVAVPEVLEPERLDRVLAGWDPARTLVFCDEAEGPADPVAALRRVPPGPLAVLVGPEGGFAPDERAAVMALPRVVALSLGPRIMRADTAAVAALALVQAVLGDWVGSAAG